MSNLLERLRSAANSNELRHEAADEIERLRAQLASARKALREIEQFDRVWTSTPYENEILERATWSVLVRGSSGQRAHQALSALTDEQGK